MTSAVLEADAPMLVQLPSAVSAFPDRKRRRRLTRKTSLKPDQAFVSVRTTSARNIILRRTACELSGLSYSVFRRSVHDASCTGWRQFLLGTYELCSACTGFEQLVEGNYPETGLRPDTKPGSIAVVVQSAVAVRSSTTPVKKPSKQAACDEDDETPTKRINQNNPSILEFATQSPQHKLNLVAQFGDLRVPVFCGLCNYHLEGNRSLNAKYVLQHCSTKKHQQALAISSGASPKALVAIDDRCTPCEGYDAVKDHEKIFLLDKYAQSVKRWRRMGGKLDGRADRR